MGGYAKAWRRRWEHPVFKDKVEAAVWAWMCDTARWKRHEFATRFGVVILDRGQLLISERQIAEDFRLHKNAVRGLLARLTQANMIALKKDHEASRAGTICTIQKYDEYQTDSISDQDDKDQDGTATRTKTGPRRDQDGTTREEREEDKKEKKEESLYGFFGKLIRLSVADFEKWQETYYAIPDLRAELLALDAWYSENLTAKQRKDWFYRTSQALNKKHQEYLGRHRPVEPIREVGGV